MGDTLSKYRVLALFRIHEDIPEAAELTDGYDGIAVGADMGDFTRFTHKEGDRMVIYSQTHYGRGIRYHKDPVEGTLSLSLDLPARTEEITLYSEILNDVHEKTGVIPDVTSGRIRIDERYMTAIPELLEKDSEKALNALRSSQESFEEILLARWRYYPDRNDIRLLTESMDIFHRLTEKLQSEKDLFHISPSMNEDTGAIYYITTEGVRTLLPRQVEIFEGKENVPYFVFHVPGKGTYMKEYNQFISLLSDKEVIPYDTFTYQMRPMTLEEVQALER